MPEILNPLIPLMVIESLLIGRFPFVSVIVCEAAKTPESKLIVSLPAVALAVAIALRNEQSFIGGGASG